MAVVSTQFRPAFAPAWAKFQYIYGTGDLLSVGKKIGGKVQYNIELGTRDPRRGFTSGCAIRMSYVLNYTGTNIPYIDGQVSCGGDGKWYIFRVRRLIEFLKTKFGPPDLTLSNPSVANLKGEQGILVFEVDARRHRPRHAVERHRVLR